MPDLKYFSIRPIKEDDLEMILDWRNSKEIRENSFQGHIITKEEHYHWYANLAKSKQNKALVFQYKNKPIGILNIKGIDKINKSCSWGFYIGERNIVNRAGLSLGYFGLDYIFFTIGIKKIYSEVFTFNNKSIGYHKRLGFAEEKESAKSVFKNNAYEEVTQFVLTKESWERLRTKIEAEIRSV